MSARKTYAEGCRTRFWSRVRRTDTCWLWTGPPGMNGYGQFWANGAGVGPHVYAYRIQCGPTRGLFVLHACDNKMCVRPDHLFLGTQADNMADKVRKGRQARGEKHGQSKLTDAQRTLVVSDPAIRVRGSMTYYAKKFGVTPAAISYIVSDAGNVVA